MMEQQSAVSTTPPLLSHLSAIISSASSASLARETRLSSSSSKSFEAEARATSFSEALVLKDLEVGETKKVRVLKVEISGTET